VGLMLAISFPSVVGGSSGGVEPATSHTLSYEFYDFFNVPFAETWDRRQALYGDRPIGFECFSAGGIANGDCTPSRADVPDVATYPYTNWYPGVGNTLPGNPNGDPWVQSAYRIRATGTNVPGYSRAAPVYFPILNAAAPEGNRLDFSWRMRYITLAEDQALSAGGCDTGSWDAYQLRSTIVLTMDLAQSARMFGTDISSVTAARNWWNTRIDPDCFLKGGIEASIENWFVSMGGFQTTVGMYDIYNAFEWYYQPFFTQVSTSVANNGVTVVTIDHLAWGTEVLMGRFLYWGATSYRDNYLDSTKAAGWFGMETSWFEDVVFEGTIGASTHAFSFSAASQYHFQQLALPGPNGILDRTDDVPYWSWAPMLVDYVNDFSPRHLLSELDRLPGGTVVQSTAGHPKYGQSLGYDFTPISWSPEAGETWTFRFPTGNLVYFDPNLTPTGAHPLDDYVRTEKPFSFSTARPAGFGSYDAGTNTWTVTGPASTGGPTGAPGDYATESWPDARLVASDAPAAPALLRVTTNPAVSGKIYVDGYPADEWGLTWVKTAPGTHTVSFGDLYGLGTPASQTVTTTAGATTEVVGAYVVHGSLRVTTQPAVPSTISVNGAPANDWGMWRAVPAGTYTVSFGQVAGYRPPADVTVTVGVGGFQHVNGVFTQDAAAPGPDPATYGLLRVTTSPAVPSQILVDGTPRDEWGLTWVKIAPGTHTVSFHGVYGVTPPAAATVSVSPGGATTTHDGVFVVHGSLRVRTNPAVAATIFVDGLPRNDWGMWQSMPPGSYVVSFEALVGFTSPAAQTVSVTSGVLTEVVGAYTPAAIQPDAAGSRGLDGAAPDAGRTTVLATTVGRGRE